MWGSLCTRTVRPLHQHGILNFVHQRISNSAINRALPSHWGSRKKVHRNIQINVGHSRTAEQEVVLDRLRNSVKSQGDHVRQLKANGSAKVDITHAVDELKLRKQSLVDMEAQMSPANSFDRFQLEDLLRRRFFYDQSFAIYGGVAGQYDFGPMGCMLLNNLLDQWRDWFVLADDALEVECSILTPEAVLKASGHLDRFVDYMVKDVQTGECFRLDHLLKGHFEKIASESGADSKVTDQCSNIIAKLDGMTMAEMNELLQAHEIRSPTTGNLLSAPTEFNLMFATQLGSLPQQKRYLRPETAQGVFVNYHRLLASNSGRLPFAVAQIGTAFRNEISPRAGLLRLREFTMAEIQHFCDPVDKGHKRFADVGQTNVLLYSACNQMDGGQPVECTVFDAVESGLVANEILGYYLARIQSFLIHIGIQPNRLRFRQHMATEMAHYARDCWDAEILTSYGWIECAGCADRSSYDLSQHAVATGTIDRATAVNPHVIEPSFGIGRIMYALLEHSFQTRPDDDQRCLLAFRPLMAPIKCTILPLSNNIERFKQIVEQIDCTLTASKIVCKTDSSSGSIGRRYARTDEIGIPYAITVDYDTLTENTVTLRERDSMEQLRIPIVQLADVVRQLTTGCLTWSELKDNPLQISQAGTKKTALMSKLDDLVKSPFFFDQSFAIYGTHVGQHDFGPAGCALKRHILDVWNDCFVIHEKMMPVKSSVLTPESVLESASHNVGFLYTPIGPTGYMNAVLRPDNAHGIFVNFKRLLEFNACKLPLAATQIGNVYRNELAPTDNLHCSYEFTVADIVYFSDPTRMGHVRFESVRDSLLGIFADGKQRNVAVGDLVETGSVSSEIVAYFLVRIQQFLQTIGIQSDRVRFRRRLNRTAEHWDAEIENGSDWIKCISCVDRHTTDLTQHALNSGCKLTTEQPLDSAQTVQVLEVLPDKSAIRRAFKKNAKIVFEQLANLGPDKLQQLQQELETNAEFLTVGEFTLNRQMISITSAPKTVHVEEIVPNVVHVSFGIDRLMGAVMNNQTVTPHVKT